MPIYVRDNRGGNWFWLHNVVVDQYGKELGPYGIAVYVCLCRHVGQEQATWVGQREIAEEIGMSRRQVQRELEQLQALALVSVETQETPHGQATNIYTLLAPPHVRESRGDDSQTRGHVSQTSPPRQGDTPYQFMNKTHGTRGSSPGKQGGAEQDPADVAHANDSAGTAPRDLWSAVLADLQEQMVPANFTRWLARTSLLRHEAGVAVVGVPDQVSAEQLAKRFDPLVRRALADACGEAVTVQYEVVEG
ncbi:MAG TPA: helix-turn-helix domain-containing protein [Chloroflexota bacterium]|jgi:hypothetical protein